MSFPVIHRHLHVYTDEEVREAFAHRIPVFFDTNVLVRFWKLHSNPRRVLLSMISDVRSQTYLPYQVQSELYEGAYKLQSIPTPGLAQGREIIRQLESIINKELEKVRPTTGGGTPTPEEVEHKKEESAGKIAELNTWIDALNKQLREWLGEPIDVRAIKRGACPNLLLEEISDAFDPEHFLPEIEQSQKERWFKEFENRVKLDDPLGPGRTDIGKGSNEQAAGDYFIWREMLGYCVDKGFSEGFIFVSEERKADIWEEKQSDDTLRRIDPRLQKEAIEMTGGPVYTMTFDEFIALVTSDENRREFLTTLSEDADVLEEVWSLEAFERLLQLLEDWDYDRQSKVIRAASEKGGYISRSDIGEVLELGQNNFYLTRFRMPADRAMNLLLKEGYLHGDVTPPLVAVYDGPGEAVGYSVPSEFSELIQELQD